MRAYNALLKSYQTPFRKRLPNILVCCMLQTLLFTYSTNCLQTISWIYVKFFQSFRKDNYLGTLEQDNDILDTIAVWKNIFSISQIVKQSVVSHAASFSWFRREKKKFFISTKYFTKIFVSTKYFTTFVLLNKSSKNIKKGNHWRRKLPLFNSKVARRLRAQQFLQPSTYEGGIIKDFNKKQMDTTRTFNITLSQLITLKQRDDGKKQTLEKA